MSKSRKNNRGQRRVLDQQGNHSPLTGSFLYDDQLNSWAVMVYYDNDLVELFVENNLEELFEEFKSFVNLEYPYVSYQTVLDKTRTSPVKQTMLASFLASHS